MLYVNCNIDGKQVWLFWFQYFCVLFYVMLRWAYVKVQGSFTGERVGCLKGMVDIQERKRYGSIIWFLKVFGVFWKAVLVVQVIFYWLGRWVGFGDMRDKCCFKIFWLGSKKGFLDSRFLNCVLFSWMVVFGYWDEGGERFLEMKIQYGFRYFRSDRFFWFFVFLYCLLDVYDVVVVFVRDST